MPYYGREIILEFSKFSYRNYSEALEESRENTRRMEGDLAAANAKIESLQAELTQHQLLFQAASDELKVCLLIIVSFNLLSDEIISDIHNQN